MTNTNNVVDLNTGRSSARSQASTASSSLPAPLVKVRDKAIEQLKTLLRKLFDNADDALFELADNAASNGEQTKYFDAMRELRLQRKQIALLMLQSAVKSFNQVGRFKLSTASNAETPTSLDSLSLVKNDELEERVAIEGMVSKTRSACGQALDHYEIRALSLLPNMNIDQAHTPCSPETLIHGFVSGCKDLDIDITAKLVVYKLFDKYVLSGADSIYSEANLTLIADGVMPDLKQIRKSTKQTQNTPDPRSSSIIDGATGELIEEASDGVDGDIYEENGGLFESLRDMLNAKSNGYSNAGGTVGRNAGDNKGTNAYNGGDLSTSMAVTEVSREQVVSVLSGVQHSLPSAQGNANDLGVMNFRALLIDQMSASGIEEPQLKRVDDDVINLVSMLFEFILDDRQLQPTMKALIARLQIPMLKVAMLDRTFFNKDGHPARKLLNEIATAAIGWNEKPEGKRDPLKEKVEYIVQNLIDDFESDFSVFDALLNEFKRFVDIESRRGQLVEQRTRDAEEGMARNETSKEYVQHSLMRITGNHDLPEPVQALLEGWGQYMSLTYLKHGEQSSEWLVAQSVAEDLVWSVCPDHRTPDARSKLLKLIPRLLKSVRAGLSEVSFDSFKSKELLKSLEGLHVNSLQLLASKPTAEEPVVEETIVEVGKTEVDPSISEEPIKSSSMLSDMDLALDDVDSILDGITASQEASAPASTAGALENIAAVESRVKLDDALVDVDVEVSEESIKMVDSLRVGSWLEFHDGDTTMRCKLAALIRVTDKYIFVDRSGIKVAEKNKNSLLEMVQAGEVSMINDGLLFDRALESVIGNLRESRKD